MAALTSSFALGLDRQNRSSFDLNCLSSVKSEETPLPEQELNLQFSPPTENEVNVSEEVDKLIRDQLATLDKQRKRLTDQQAA
jgi:hypothetical protein